VPMTFEFLWREPHTFSAIATDIQAHYLKYDSRHLAVHTHTHAHFGWMDGCVYVYVYKYICVCSRASVSSCLTDCLSFLSLFFSVSLDAFAQKGERKFDDAAACAVPSFVEREGEEENAGSKISRENEREREKKKAYYQFSRFFLPFFHSLLFYSLCVSHLPTVHVL
jgi:hypothetical protein